MESRTCRTCKNEKPLTEFYPCHQGKRIGLCKECSKAQTRAYKKANPEKRKQYEARDRDNGGRERNRKWLQERRKRIPPKRYPVDKAKNRIWSAAKKAVDKAIKNGKLVRPDTCEQCGESGIPIEAAHSDYSQPLLVRWLCRPCHRTWDWYEPKTHVVQD
jgi:hypothetical protein